MMKMFPNASAVSQETADRAASSRLWFLDLLRGINGGQGTTVVVITHDAEAASYAGRRIVLADGVVEYDESA